MIINHNLNAMNANRMVNVNSAKASKAMAQLSSGLRINSASDDASGLAISEKMKGQISGLDTASSNAQTAVSLTQTADGALSETTAVLQRMRELAVQSSNDTNTDADRSAIQVETTALTAQIDNIATTTQFNTKNLLDGSMGKAVTAASANVNTSSILKDASGAVVDPTALALTDLSDSNGNSLNIKATDTITVSYDKAGVTTSNTFLASAAPTVADLNTTADPTDPTGATAGTPDANFAVTAEMDTQATPAATGKLLITAGGTGSANAIEGISITVKDSTGKVNVAATNALSSFSETKSAGDVRADGTATVQIGANVNQNLSIDINDMGSSALGVAGLQVGTQNEANVAIKAIDNATARVSSERAKLGAFQNRLSSTINNLGTTSQNLSSAQSSIADVDMAATMAEFSKNNIESQAAQAMIAQANQQPQQVLQLLR